MHGRKAGLNRLSTGVGKRQERTTPRRAWAKGSYEPPIDGRGRGVFKKNQPPLDGRGRRVGTNRPSTGVGVVFLKNQPHLGGRGRGVFC